MGKLRYKNDQTLNLADLPGLIEGAHLNKGLGHKFLKHVERTKILLFLIDGSIDPNIDKKRNPIKDYFTLKNELEQYDLDIMKKPFLIVSYLIII
jgi:GTP-binding protein